MAKLVKFININGIMEVKSGLSILGNKDSLGPGGVDNPVVKNPLSGEPYIPGTSLKGKMRSKLEETIGRVDATPCGCGRKDCMICTLFGAHRNIKSEAGASRILFRDMSLTDEFKGKLDNIDTIVESKIENMVDRKTKVASTGSLRNRERIAAGVKFNYEFVVQIYEGDDENKILDTLNKGLDLVEMTGLGGKTSGGYGQVDFHRYDDTFKMEEVDVKTGKVKILDK